MRTRFHLFAVCCLLLLPALPSAAQDNQEQTLTVGTKVAEPFVIKHDDGTFSGITIDLWRTIADDLNLNFEFQETDIEGLLDGLEDGSFDLTASALTLSPEREARIDFSHPYYRTGLAIATRPTGGDIWGYVQPFLTWEFSRAVGALVLVIFAVGLLIWLFERKRNDEEFGGSTAEGIGSAFWWSAVTMTTVGYGDKSPRTVGGRMIGMIWMFVAIIVISSLTAAIASVVTVGQLGAPIKGPSELGSVKVGSVANSAPAQYLQQTGIFSRRYDTLNDAIVALVDGDVDAVVYDAPILSYVVRSNFPGDAIILPERFELQDYGFGFPEDSELIEHVNRAVLRNISSDRWQQMLQKYLGK